MGEMTKGPGWVSAGSLSTKLPAFCGDSGVTLIVRKIRNLGVKQGGMRARARLVREDPSRDLCELQILSPGRLDPPSYRVRFVGEIAVGEPIYAFTALPDEIGVPIKGNI